MFTRAKVAEYMHIAEQSKKEHKRNGKNIRISVVNDNNKRESAREVAYIVVDMLEFTTVIDKINVSHYYAYRLIKRKRVTC